METNKDLMTKEEVLKEYDKRVKVVAWFPIAVILGLAFLLWLAGRLYEYFYL